MNGFSRMLYRLGIAQKEHDPETLYKQLWTMPGQRSATTRGMVLGMLSAEEKKRVQGTFLKDTKED